MACRVIRDAVIALQARRDVPQVTVKTKIGLHGVRRVERKSRFGIGFREIGDIFPSAGWFPFFTDAIAKQNIENMTPYGM